MKSYISEPLKNSFFVRNIAKYHNSFVQGEAGVPWNSHATKTVWYPKKSCIHKGKRKHKALITKKQMSSFDLEEREDREYWGQDTYHFVSAFNRSKSEQ